MREKSDLGKCYRCWAFGVLAGECKEPDSSKSCLNCREVSYMHVVFTKESRCNPFINGAEATNILLHKEDFNAAIRKKMGF